MKTKYLVIETDAERNIGIVKVNSTFDGYILDAIREGVESALLSYFHKEISLADIRVSNIHPLEFQAEFNITGDKLNQFVYLKETHLY